MSGLIVCAAIFAGINQTYAQNTKPHLGFKAGIDEMTLGSINQNGGKGNYDYRVGLQIGLYADVPLSSKLSFIPQALFTQKGGKLTGPTTAPNSHIITAGEIDYFDVPLLIGFKLAPRITISAGPQVSFFSSQNTTRQEVGSFDIVNGRNYTNDGFKKVLIGGNVGVGYAFCRSFGLNLHYMHDFQSPGSGNSTLINGEINSGFALTVSYLF